MNPAALLALISDLYEQVAQLRADNEDLRQQLANGAPPAGSVDDLLTAPGSARA